MVFFILSFFNLSPCSAPNDTLLNFSNQYYDSIEINNIGDPILYLIPKNHNKNIVINHMSKEIRKVDYDSKLNISVRDSIYSFIKYQNCYNTGGRLKTFLSRPISEKIYIQFLYDNLSSEGFYPNQHNKYNNLNVSFDYSNNKKYHSSLSFSSLNTNYENNGGIISHNLSGLDLSPTFLNTAETTIKKRKINFSQKYLFPSGLKLAHHSIFSMFKRDYNDMTPMSYHYSMTPLDYLILDYNLHTFFQTFSNTFTLTRNDSHLSIIYNYFNTNDLNPNRIQGDVIISFDQKYLFKNHQNFDFKFQFSPLGYNKNSHLINMSFSKKSNNFHHVLSFDQTNQKPDFFRKHYDTFSSWDWFTFSNFRMFNFRLKSFVIKRGVQASISLNRTVNYFYFNEFVSPTQLETPLIYLNFQIKKSWQFDPFIFNSSLTFQHSNNEVLSIPFFVYQQKIKYSVKLFTDSKLTASINTYLFSSYYPNYFFPLTDVFYQQLNEKTKFQPFFSVDTHISKKTISFGLIADNLQNLLFEDSYFIPTYYLPQPTLRFSISWIFID